MPTTAPEPRRHVLHVFATFGAGGSQVRLARVSRALGPRYRHTVVAVDGEFGALALCDPALVRPLAVPRPAGRLPTPAHLLRLRRILAGERPDLLLTCNWGSIDWALANRLAPLCPHRHIEEGFGPEEAGGRQLRRRVWTRRLALGGASRLVVVSRGLEAIARGRWRLPAERVARIPNGVDCAALAAAAPAVPPLRRRPGEVVVIAVGGLRPEKRPDRLARIVAALPPEPPVRLVLVGDGPERAALEPLAAASGGRIELLGHRAEVAGLLAGADLFALTSDTEQMPIALVEAMAVGLPVVATAVGDVPHMVAAEGRPFLAAPADEAGLARALRELVADPALRHRLGRANQARARAYYDAAAMLEAWAALLDGHWPPPPPRDGA
jgi:glycosyltransferase involved in cell wall biosynthesis